MSPPSTLVTPAGREVFTLDGDVTRDNFVAIAEPRGATPKDDPLCFAEGTLILTTDGEIRSKSYSQATAPFCRTAAPRQLPSSASAISTSPTTRGGMPCSQCESRPARWKTTCQAATLLVSPDHAIYLSGALIPARHLIDDLRIRQERGAKWVRYYHVELATHGILIAEGAPAESFLDTGQRALFDNAGTPGRPQKQCQ